MDPFFIFTYLKQQVEERLQERTTWDGVILVAAGLAYLLFKPLATILAWIAIAWGIWTIWKREK